MKKLFAVLVALLMLVGCSSTPSSSAAPASSGEEPAPAEKIEIEF